MRECYPLTMNNEHKQTVYIVRAGWDYDGSRVLAVFSTIEAAEHFMSVQETQEVYDFVLVEPFIVDNQ